MPKMIDPEQEKIVPKVSNEVPIDENCWEIKDLPSQGKFYNGQKIFGRPLKVLDLKKLSKMDEDNTTDTIETILKRCVKGINVDEILTPDKLYIIFWLRYNTFKDKGYQVKYDCMHCKKESEYHFDLNMLDVTNLTDEMYNKMVVKLPSGDIRLKFQTIGSEKLVEAFTKKYKEDPLFELNEDVLNLAACIDSKKGLKETYDWLVDMDPSEYGELENVMDELSIGVVPFVTAACKLCKGENLIGISFRTRFLFPKNTN